MSFVFSYCRAKICYSASLRKKSLELQAVTAELNTKNDEVARLLALTDSLRAELVAARPQMGSNRAPIRHPIGHRQAIKKWAGAGSPRPSKWGGLEGRVCALPENQRKIIKALLGIIYAICMVNL